MEIKGSETEKNLLKAFAGESQARNRYTFFASVARKEGFVQISEIFLETAENEKEHAEIFFKYLEGGSVEIEASYPAGRIGATKENLLAAADGEKMEWSNLYPEFAKVAAEEGFDDVANSFREIAIVEGYHERRYRKLLKNVQDGKVFERGEVVKWKCSNCGYVHEGTEAPDVCPSCKHARKYFEIWVEGY
jgi:rubrerythrin